MAEWARKRPLLEQRATAWEAMKGLLDAAESEKRDLEGTEIDTYAEHEKVLDAATRQLEVIASAEKREGVMATIATITPEEARALLPGGGEPVDAEQRKAEQTYLAEFRTFLKSGGTVLPKEPRAIQVDNDIEGGYLLAPQVLAAGIISALNNEVFMRNFAHKETVMGAQSLGIPTLDTDMSDADWTAELTQTTVDTALRTGKRELKPNYLTKEAKISRALVRRTAGAIESLVLDRLTYKFAVTQEKGFLTGTGAAQPLGVFTASALGISTGRDVATDNTTTAITTDGLINAKFSVRSPYWRRGRWIFHRDAIKMIRKLKDGEGQYLWHPGTGVATGLSSGIPSTIVDSPYDISEYAPNTFTAGLYVGIFGDFEFYWIADALGLEIQVLNELYARTNQFGYIGRLETDGMPVLEEAFARVTLAP